MIRCTHCEWPLRVLAAKDQRLKYNGFILRCRCPRCREESTLHIPNNMTDQLMPVLAEQGFRYRVVIDITAEPGDQPESHSGALVATGAN